MDYKTTLDGSCLCGAVEISATVKHNRIGVCHCAMCRTWCGGPLFAVECKDEVQFEGIEHIGTFSTSEWAERGFCKRCGTHLFYRLKQEMHYAIPVGLLEDNDQWRLSEQIFIEQKPSFYSFTQNTKNMTGEQVFAQYSDD